MMTGGGSRSRSTAIYERWVRDYASELFGFAYRLCGDRETADDLIQETFYEAWKSREGLRHEDRARAWLFQILRHRYGRWRRVESRGPVKVPLDSAKLHIAGAGAETAGARRDDLQQALDRLSDRLKLPLLMVLSQGMTCQEAADSLDLPLGTVLSRIHRAKRKLRDTLRAGEEDDQRTPAGEPYRRFQIGGEP